MNWIQTEDHFGTVVSTTVCRNIRNKMVINLYHLYHSGSVVFFTNTCFLWQNVFKDPLTTCCLQVELHWHLTQFCRVFVCVCYKCCSVRCAAAAERVRFTDVLHSLITGFREQSVWHNLRRFTSPAGPLCSLFVRLLVPTCLQCIPVSIRNCNRVKNPFLL